ncbi:MAG TPA: hypothetical protein VFT22_04455, partial [Kofleriaceae bacterium]|nr:hypothetical protein [Kofleriaceae bacterium]
MTENRPAGLVGIIEIGAASGAGSDEGPQLAIRASQHEATETIEHERTCEVDIGNSPGQVVAAHHCSGRAADLGHLDRSPPVAVLRRESAAIARAGPRRSLSGFWPESGRLSEIR